MGAPAAYFLILLFAALLGIGPAVADPVGIIGARLGQNGKVTRFVLETTAAPTGAQATVASDPHRVVIDLPSTGWAGRVAPSGAGTGIVTSYQIGAVERGRVRVTLDLAGPGVVRKAFAVPPEGSAPNRYVVDVEPAAAQVVALQAPRVPVPQSSAQAPTKIGIVPPPPKRPDTRRLVVVDAGHGGVDPGTIGASGTHEKTVTLAVAKELKAVLEASGRYKVVLTRDDDVFIRLRERVAKARAAGAELFISLHADSIGDRKHRGASVYTLSEIASDKEAEALAAKENKADLIGGLDLSHETPEVANILLDLAQRETMNYSARFAVSLVEELDRAAKININPHRFAGFAVLKAPDVPSVLIEMGYLSNAQDEKALRDAGQRKRMAAAILKACDRFFAEKRS